MTDYMDRVKAIVGEHFTDKTVAVYNWEYTTTIAEACTRTGAKVLRGTAAETGYVDLVIDAVSSLGEFYIALSRVEQHRATGVIALCFGLGEVGVMVISGEQALHSAYVWAANEGQRMSEHRLIGSHHQSINGGTHRWLVTTALCYGVKHAMLRRTDKHDPAFDAMFNQNTYPVFCLAPDGVFGRVQGNTQMPPSAIQAEQTQMFPIPSTVLIIGAGTAAWIYTILKEYFAELVVVDGKKVSPYNICRQPYAEDEIGMNKVDAKVFAHAHTKRVCMHIETKKQIEDLLSTYKPHVVVVGTGDTNGINHVIGEALREHKIPGVFAGMLPGATYYKATKYVPGGPCYSCYQGKSNMDSPTLSVESRELYYGGTQPATVFDTYPSAALCASSAYRLVTTIPELHTRGCVLGANTTQEKDGKTLYGVSIGNTKRFAPQDLNSPAACEVCGNLNGDPFLHQCVMCDQEATVDNMFCSQKHKIVFLLRNKKQQALTPEGV